MMKPTGRHLHLLMALSLLLSCRALAAGEGWIAPTDPGVVTTNDCGYVSAVSGDAVIRRSFMPENSPGAEARMADRLNAGDTIEAPHAGGMEIISGHNIIIAIGPGSKLRLGGVRSFVAADGTRVSRLDVVLERGEMRCQARLNETNPETLLAELNGADVLLERGDLNAFSTPGWKVAVLAGEAFARIRRGGVVGAPFPCREGTAVGSAGEERLGAEVMALAKGRLPFSFETARAALPPRPAASDAWEAP